MAETCTIAHCCVLVHREKSVDNDSLSMCIFSISLWRKLLATPLQPPHVSDLDHRKMHRTFGRRGMAINLVLELIKPRQDGMTLTLLT